MKTKILFVENRQKTRFWHAISKELKNDNLHISWITQNKFFSVDKHNHVLPKPSIENLQYSENFKEIEISDRYSKIYKNVPKHYEHYYQEILKILKIEKPKIVFGEATLFHELLTIKACKELGITYLHPISCRYPSGRFSFYEFDTLEPYYGSFQKWNKNKIKKQIDDINNRTISPDYMLKRNFLFQIKFIYKRILSIFESLVSRIYDKYNTPSVIEKIKIEFSCKKNFSKFKQISTLDLENFSPNKTIVYPLQMEPESNLDVWAKLFNNQTKNIKTLREHLSPDITILIKANPKSRYEMNDELIRVINDNKNIIAINPAIRMEDIFKKFNYFFSPTGTIGIESLLASKTCFSPCLEITKLFLEECSCFPKELKRKILPEEDKIKILEYLISSSFEGIIGDEVHSEKAMNKGNIRVVCDAFEKIIEFNNTHKSPRL